MNNEKKNVVCFGEVLWDILPSGKVPGGAPMNVAYHLHQHDIPTAIITRIGNDQLGEDIKQWFSGKGMDTRYFQVDTVHATGQVYATPGEDGGMSYEIANPAAWDFIALDQDNISLVEQADYLVFGSLASRSTISRKTLLRLLECPAIKVMDINLRPPHFTTETLMVLMKKADILKVNEDELHLVSEWEQVVGSMNDKIKGLSERLNIPTLIVTRGADGAILFTENKFYEHKGYKVDVVDTVGSGDAFLAGFLTKLIPGAEASEALDYAARLGAFVTGKKGGCPESEVGGGEGCFLKCF